MECSLEVFGLVDRSDIEHSFLFLIGLNFGVLFPKKTKRNTEIVFLTKYLDHTAG